MKCIFVFKNLAKVSIPRIKQEGLDHEGDNSGESRDAGSWWYLLLWRLACTWRVDGVGIWSFWERVVCNWHAWRRAVKNGLSFSASVVSLSVSILVLLEDRVKEARGTKESLMMCSDLNSAANSPASILVYWRSIVWEVLIRWRATASACSVLLSVSWQYVWQIRRRES